MISLVSEASPQVNVATKVTVTVWLLVVTLATPSVITICSDLDSQVITTSVWVEPAAGNVTVAPSPNLVVSKSAKAAFSAATFSASVNWGTPKSSIQFKSTGCK